MSEKTNYAANPGNPAAQPFNVGARKNKTKERSWWNTASPTFWRNPKQGKKKADKAAEASE